DVAMVDPAKNTVVSVSSAFSDPYVLAFHQACERLLRPVTEWLRAFRRVYVHQPNLHLFPSLQHYDAVAIADADDFPREIRPRGEREYQREAGGDGNAIDKIDHGPCDAQRPGREFVNRRVLLAADRSLRDTASMTRT